MNQIFKKITAVLMTFVVLFSTMSFAVSEHYCGDELVNSAIFSRAKSCEMKMDIQISSSTEDCYFDKEDCCSDIIKLVEGQNVVKTQILNLNIEQQALITLFGFTYINLFEGLEKNVVPFKYHTPPLLIRDIQILDSVFLI